MFLKVKVYENLNDFHVSDLVRLLSEKMVIRNQIRIRATAKLSRNPD